MQRCQNNGCENFVIYYDTCDDCFIVEEGVTLKTCFACKESIAFENGMCEFCIVGEQDNE